MKQVILFKHPGLFVYQAKGGKESFDKSSAAFLKTKDVTIPLDAEATEVLVGYLQVMRAFMANFEKRKNMDTRPYEQVGTFIEQRLKSQNKTKANYKDITELIKQMGCLHDWAAGKVLFLPGQQP